MAKLLIKRVSYGSKDTPYNKREYKLAYRPSPVGFKSDWIQFAKKKGYNGVKIVK